MESDLFAESLFGFGAGIDSGELIDEFVDIAGEFKSEVTLVIRVRQASQLPRLASRHQ